MCLVCVYFIYIQQQLRKKKKPITFRKQKEEQTINTQKPTVNLAKLFHWMKEREMKGKGLELLLDGKSTRWQNQ